VDLLKLILNLEIQATIVWTFDLCLMLQEEKNG
jgi:hypothetical protein